MTHLTFYMALDCTTTHDSSTPRHCRQAKLVPTLLLPPLLLSRRHRFAVIVTTSSLLLPLPLSLPLPTIPVCAAAVAAFSVVYPSCLCGQAKPSLRLCHFRRSQRCLTAAAVLSQAKFAPSSSLSSCHCRRRQFQFALPPLLLLSSCRFHCWCIDVSPSHLCRQANPSQAKPSARLCHHCRHICLLAATVISSRRYSHANFAPPSAAADISITANSSLHRLYCCYFRRLVADFVTV